MRLVPITAAILDWCVSCQRQNASACDEVPADLPAQRFRIEDPFLVTWIDFAGSFEVLVHEPSILSTVLNTGEVPRISGNVKFQDMTPQWLYRRSRCTFCCSRALLLEKSTGSHAEHEHRSITKRFPAVLRSKASAENDNLRQRKRVRMCR